MVGTRTWNPIYVWKDGGSIPQHSAKYTKTKRTILDKVSFWFLLFRISFYVRKSPQVFGLGV